MLVAVVLAALAACSSGGGGTPAPASPAIAQALTSTAGTTGLEAAALLYPGSDGAFDQSHFMQWNAVPTATSYELQLGSVLGSADLYDSGPIAVTQVRVPGLPTARTLFGTLATQYDSGAVLVSNFEFTVSGSDMTVSQRYDIARALAADVRNMADINNVAQAGSLLAATAAGNGRAIPNCVDFADTQLTMIAQMNLGVQSRQAAACLIPNAFDCHTLVEILNEGTGRWELSDPTFGLAPHNASDASIATLDDMRTAAREQNWSGITYEYFTANTSEFAEGYYLDYPLLFVHTYVSGTGTTQLADGLFEATVQDFYTPVGSVPSPGHYGAYALQCPSGATQATAGFDGTTTTLACDPNFGVTKMTTAYVVLPQGGASVSKPVRNVFPSSNGY